MSGFISPVRYNQSRLLAVDYRVFRNPNEVGERIDMSESRRTYEVVRAYRTGEDEELYAAICKLSLTMNILENEASEDDDPVACFSCSFEVLATVPKDFGQEDETKRFLTANALAYLWGKMRELCESVSAASSTGKVTLPAMDPYLVLGDEGEEEGESEE